MQKTIIKSLLLIIAFTFALSANYIFAVWTGPTQTPPGGNTPTPVHVGATDQVKDAGLSLNSLAVFGAGFFDGNVGIGTTNPSAGGEHPLKLDVEGAIGAKYYCDENGNNCASAPLGGGNSIAFLANKNGIDQLVLAPNNIIEWDKITFASEEFDIGNYYNNANSRYTPPAGIYYIGGSYTQATGPRDMLIALHKNGVKIKEDYGNSNSGAGGSVPFGVVVSVNGADYLELYAGFGGNTMILGDSTKTYFYGFKIGKESGGGGSLNSTTFTNPTKTLGGTAYPLCVTVAGDSASLQMTTINQFCSEKGYEFGEVFDLSTNAGNYAYYYNSSWTNNSCGAKAFSVKCFK